MNCENSIKTVIFCNIQVSNVKRPKECDSTTLTTQNQIKRSLVVNCENSINIFSKKVCHVELDDTTRDGKRTERIEYWKVIILPEDHTLPYSIDGVHANLSVDMFKNRIHKYLIKVGYTWESTCGLSISCQLPGPLSSKVVQAILLS